MSRLRRFFRFALFLLLSACVPRLPPVVKIGLIAPFEGPYRYQGYDAVYAARLAVREINAAGGAGGYYLELVAYDDRGDPELAPVAARNLAVDPAVVAVIGSYRQESTEAAAALLAAEGLPLIAVGAWLPREVGVWHLAPSPETLAETFAAAAEGAVTEVWGAGPLAQAVPLLPGAEARIVSLLPPVETAERWQAREGAGQLVGGPELAAGSFAAVAGDSAEGVRFVTPYPFPETLSGLAAWQEAYRAVGPHVPDPGPYALPTYEAVHALAAAIAAAAQEGEPSRERVAAALPEVQREGALGSLAWGDTAFWETAPLFIYVWREGVPQLLAPFP